MDLGQNCRQCGRRLVDHVMYYREDWTIDRRHPIQCPATAGEWISWAEALPVPVLTDELETVETGGRL